MPLFLPVKRMAVGVSFDAQNTLVEIIGGIGQQYFKHFRQFLEGKGFSIEEVMPSCTATSLHTTSYTIMRYSVNRDREIWSATHPEAKDKKEMPIGGRTEGSITQFWRQTMSDVFKSPSLYLSTPPRLKQSLLDVMEGPEWDDFLRELIQSFASKQAYGWLPEGLRTLEELRVWSGEQEQLAFQESPGASSPSRSGNAGRRGSSGNNTNAYSNSTAQQGLSTQNSSFTTSVKTKPILVLAAAPFVITNSDFRIRGVLRDLGAFQSSPLPPPTTATSATPASSSSSSAVTSTLTFSSTCWSAGKKMPPLLGKVITAADVGYAKPSDKGLLHCIKECGLEQHPERFIHVGDTEDDEIACRRAGCRFLQCNASMGAQWEKLKAMLGEVEKEVLDSFQ